jgi:Glycosyltransferase family 9 (heptosyltransferase)
MNDGTWLLLHAGALGDLALALRLALELSGRPESGIDVISRADLGDLRDAAPPLRRRSLDGLGSHALYSADVSLSEPLSAALRGRRVLSFLGSADATCHARILAHGAAAVISLDPRPLLASRRHILEQWRHALAGQGHALPTCSRKRRLTACVRPGEEMLRRGDSLLGPRPRVLMHPGSGSPQKNWPLDEFLACARVLRDSGVNVHFLYGPVEAERLPSGDRERVQREFPCIDAGRDLPALLAAADCLIGNDSGPAHVASLLATPSVALFGPTDRRIWSPPGVSALQGDPSIGPAWGRTVADVVAAVRGVRK